MSQQVRGIPHFVRHTVLGERGGFEIHIEVDADRAITEALSCPRLAHGVFTTRHAVKIQDVSRGEGQRRGPQG